MKQWKIIPLIFCIFLIDFCHKKNPTGPVGNNIHLQSDIPWPSLADSPWPITHGDMQCTGRSKYSGPREGKVVWTFSEQDFIFEESGIVIGEDNTIYFTARIRGPERHHALYALNPDGSLKWKQKLNVTYSYSPTPILGRGDFIYVIRQDGRFYSFDSDGNLQKILDTSTSNFTFGPGLSLDETFYFVDVMGTMYALNKDGSVKWSNTNITDLYIPSSYSLSFSPDGSTIYAAMLDSSLNAINSEDGKILWKLKIGYNLLYSSPLVDSDNHIYFPFEDSEKGFILCSVNSDGSIRWKSEDNVGYMASAHMDKNGNIYTHAGGLNLISFDYNGKTRWKSFLVDGDIWQWPTSIIGDSEGYVYIAMPWRYVIAFDNDGNKKFVCELPDRSDWLIMGSISKDGHLYVASKYQVYCIK